MKTSAKTKKLLAASALTVAGMLAVSGFAAPVRTFASAATAGKTYTSDYESKDAAREAGLDLNEEIAAEGAVLIKNINNTLPAKITVTQGTDSQGRPTTSYSNNRLSVFGYTALNPVGGGGANDVEASAGRVAFSSSFFDTFESAHYVVNPKLKGLYEGANADSTVRGDADIDKENFSLPSFLESYENYNDAAVIILGDADSNEGDEYTPNNSLDYGQAQRELVDFVADKFDKVIVVIDKSVPMEIEWLKQHDGVGAILVAGEGGTNGLDVIGRIVSGEINPSGRLVDTYNVNHDDNPSLANYNELSPTFSGNDGAYPTYIVDDMAAHSAELQKYIPANATEAQKAQYFNRTFLAEYEEGIYVGYRYWETRGYEETQAGNAGWYDAHVSYPFGHGLSYTNFEWELQNSSTPAGAIQAKGTIKFDVKVTNKGSVAGKDVVQVYYTAPLSRANLIIFSKTATSMRTRNLPINFRVRTSKEPGLQSLRQRKLISILMNSRNSCPLSKIIQTT